MVVLVLDFGEAPAIGKFGADMTGRAGAHLRPPFPSGPKDLAQSRSRCPRPDPPQPFFSLDPPFLLR